MSAPRYFVHFAAATVEDGHDKAESHGRPIEVKMHADPHGGWVYGSAEVEPVADKTGGNE